MLDEYRIEPLSVGQYLDGINNEDTKIDQAVQRSFCWNKEMMNSLIYSALSRKIYIPNLILAEEKREDGTKQTYVVDGGQRTESLYQFKYCGYKITNNLRTYMIPYRKKKMDENGNILRDEYGNIQYEMDEFDIRRKTYDDLPDELKNKFDGCPLTTVVYQDCTTEQTSELVMLYNNHVGMNVSQKSLTYVGKYADEIKRIKDTSRFLMDCTVLTENEKRKGIWERVISESVMAVYHFEYWKKVPKDMCSYLNQHSSKEEYKNIESYFNRLIPYSDKLKNTKTAELFTSKNLFVWMKIFDKFSRLHIPDDNFGEFLKAFTKNLKFKEVNGEDWDSIDNNRHTKDKSLVVKKVNYLETLMNDFFYGEFEEMNQLVSFIAGNLKMDADDVQSDIDFYEESLEKLKDDTIKDGSKLLEQENHYSLLAMMVYSYQEDKDLEEWMTQYAVKNESYFTDQKKNFLYMKEDFEKYYSNQKGSCN
jgi:Archaeal/vacuolar-type H+-ATPase subunit B